MQCVSIVLCLDCMFLFSEEMVIPYRTLATSHEMKYTTHKMRKMEPEDAETWEKKVNFHQTCVSGYFFGCFFFFGFGLSLG